MKNRIVVITQTGYTYGYFVEMARLLNLDVDPQHKVGEGNSNKVGIDKSYMWRLGDIPKSGDICYILDSGIPPRTKKTIYGLSRIKDGRQFLISSEGFRLTDDYHTHLPEELFEL